MLIVVALVAILATIGVLAIDPLTVRGTEYDKNAESVAVAAQSRLVSLRNSGELEALRSFGEPAEADAGAGGYRYLFSYRYDEDGATCKDARMR